MIQSIAAVKPVTMLSLMFPIVPVMPDNRNRKRPIQVKFFVDERELSLIKARMAQLRIENMSAYLRKMEIDG